MNIDNLQEILIELLDVPASEITSRVLELKEVELRLMDKLNTMNKTGEVDLNWVHEIFYQVLKGYFKGR